MFDSDNTNQILREIGESTHNANRILYLIFQELQAANGYLAQIERNTRPPHTQEIGIHFSTPKEI